MYARVMALLAILTTAVVANGYVAASYSEIWSGVLPESGLVGSQWEVAVSVSGFDSWTAAGIDLELTGATFYQSALNDGDPPDPDFFHEADSEYTSFYTVPGDWPNADYDGGLTRFARDEDTPTTLGTDWFENTYRGDGDFVLTRFTVIPDDQQNPAWSGVGELIYADQNSGGVLFHMDIWIPEPGTLTLVALGVLAVFRRR